jgi:hypothetical protein
MPEPEEPELTVSGLNMQELSELIDSLDPNLVGVFDSFEALVRYAEGSGKLSLPRSLHATAGSQHNSTMI